MLITNSSFEYGAAGWRPVNYASNVTQEIVSDGTARSGTNFLRTITTQAGGSVAFDFEAMYGSGDFAVPVFSVGVLTWIRSLPGQGPVNGELAIWQLGTGNTGAGFNVGDDWTLITNCIDFNPAGGILTRIEFYLGTVNAFLDIDSVLAF
jgi:hypothetical protein